MSRALLLLLALPGTGCAWTQRENRAVWNAFEANLVPADTTAFLATLPLTVPLGLGAIVLDTAVVHPVQVLDDAFDDAAWLWRDGRPDFAGRYYSELAFLPLRAASTPAVLIGSFAARSLFAFPTEQEKADRARVQARREARAAADLRAWLAQIAAGGVEEFRGRMPQKEQESFAPDFASALATANALGRLELYRAAADLRVPGHMLDLRLGLRDPDPVVRFHVLEWLDRDVEVDPDLVTALREDPVEAVRMRARKRWKE